MPTQRWMTGVPPEEKPNAKRLINTSSVADPTCTQPVRLRIKRFTGTTARMHVKPKIKPVSAIIDPTPLPRARPGLPIKAAITETNASGVVVPR